MGRAKTAQDPSIESLLDSIRRAIHDGSAAPDEPAAARAQPAASPSAKAAAGDSPLPGRARPAPLRPVPPQAPPAQSAELGSVKPPLRSVQTRPAPQPPGVTGSMREMRVSLAPAPSGPGALSARTDDFLALRNRLANLSVTRDRLSRTLSGQDNGFAGILGGDVRLEEALARAGGPKVAEHMPAYESFRDNAPALRDEAMHPASSLDDIVYAQSSRNGSQFAAGYERDPATYDPLGGAYDEPLPLAEEPHYGYGAPDLPDAGPTDDYLDPPNEPGRAWLPAHTAYPARHAAADPSGMLSADASVATASAFNRLADTIVAQATAGNRSVEDITREVLRPMLKSWLDEHLPRVVERLVREEIERVARRGGR
jgi:cell pole-organizing protein PopZ